MAGPLSGLAVEGRRMRFGWVSALDGDDLEGDAGELLVVVGPSGCGKSTLLRCIAGLEAIDEGSVRIGGRELTRLPPATRNVSMVFQSYALFPHLTVAENIGVGLVLRDDPKREIEGRVADAAQLVGVRGLLERRPFELSGGERQRVALARALVRKPDAFLLDEPLSNLDAGTRVATRTELKRLHREVGATTVYVTHDQVEALTLGDRIAVMDSGRVRQVGTPDEVYGEPRDRFVAAFVGSPAMNFLDAEPAKAFLPVPAGATVGIRPEHVRIGGDGVQAYVELVEVAGSDAFLHLANGIVARVGLAGRPAEGDWVNISFAREQAHLFDAETGARRPWA